MNKQWVNFYSGYYEDEGCKKPPFEFLIRNYCARRSHLPQFFKEKNGDYMLDNDGNIMKKNDCVICAMIEANNETEIWELVSKYFPDYSKI